MRYLWLVLILLLTACAPPKYDLATPTSAPLRIATAKQVVHPTPKFTKRTGPPVASTPAPWKAIAKSVKGNAQRAMSEVLWEDVEFKKETYTLCRKMVLSANDHSLNDVCKRLRWGMEFMDKGQLEDAIRILDNHD